MTSMDDRPGLVGIIGRFSKVISRRSALGAAVAVALAEAAPTVASPLAEACAGIGARCGKGDQPSCRTCCTGFTTRQPNTGQRRCACRPDFKRCNRPDQCCSGICRTVRCAGFDRPVCVPGLFGSVLCERAASTDR
jgi:hypothetical protein